MTLDGDLSRPLRREAAPLALGAALGVMTAFVSASLLGSWSLVAGLVVLAGARLSVGRGDLPVLRRGLNGSLIGWAAVATILLVLLLAIPVDPALD